MNETVTPELIRAVRAAAGPAWTLPGVVRATVEAAAPAIRAAERERIRSRLVGCPKCGEIHAEHYPEGYYDHPNKAPWRAAGPNALAFLDELLGVGPLP